MNRIMPEAIWVGHAGDGRDFARLRELGIKAIVQVALDELPLQLPRDLIYCRCPLQDGAGNRATELFLAVSTVALLLKMHVPVLVCCGAGQSRAPAVAAAALALFRGASPPDCLAQVAQCHPTDVSPGLWTELTSVLPVSGLG